MLRCLYFGTDKYSARVLQGLLSNRNSVVKKLDVVCPPQKALKIKGKLVIKPSPVELSAKDNNLDVFYYDKVKQDVNQMVCHYDVGVVVSFGYLLPHKIIKWFPRGCINVHPSLLPKYRGAAPLHHTVINGDSVSGCTVVELSSNKFDCGPVLLQRKHKIVSSVTTELLSDQLADLGSKMLCEILTDLDHFEANKQMQDDKQATLASKMTKQMGHIKFNIWTADYCDRIYRAIGVEYGIWVQFGSKMVRLVEIHTNKDWTTTNDKIPGMLTYNRRSQLFTLHFKQGHILVSRLQVATRRPTTAAEFYNGYISAFENKTVILESINLQRN
ncbi:methionyl-tRNA formyltransferase, mitochondrial-like [Dysidea avara]|uniref:methionyl-tRNA formyltransferase, mitochondrial-like n=1 Tax=Dysidea avara TaxID=196820 RepID=UPI0033265481